MPGIVGIVGRGAPEEYGRLIDMMIGTLRHAPSCVSGAHSSPELGVYTGWVAHEGSYSARQSAKPQEYVSLAFVGECFPSSSDARSTGTEIDVLGRYAQHGSRFVGGLNGLFSGVIIDRERRCALLFNDRYASERVYVHEGRDAVFFASEAKALLAVIPETRSLDADGVAQFLAYGSTERGRTLFRDISLAPGGCLWRFEPGRQTVKGQYFEPREWEAQPVLTETEFESQFVETARTVFPVYAEAKQAVGISITGGLDTRMIMACLPQTEPKPICYTFAGMTGETLDVRIGRRVARGAGLAHHVLRVTKEFVASFGSYVDRTVFVTDGCAGALTAHEILLTSMGRGLAPIRLTGNFGSEILRSMSTLKPREIAADLIEPAFRMSMDRAMLREAEPNPVTQSAFREVPLHLFGALAAGRSQITFRTPYLDNALVKLAYQAPVAARNSPNSALRLIDAAAPGLARIPTDRGLSLGATPLVSAARRAFSDFTFKLDYFDKEGLPGVLGFCAPLFGPVSMIGLLGLHKFLPYRTWFRTELKDYVAAVIGSSRTLEQPYWSRSFLQTMARDHALGRSNYVQEIASVLTLEAIDRVLVSARLGIVSDRRGKEAVTQ